MREELLAATVEQLQRIIYLLHAAWFKEPHPEPVRLPRPGDDQPEPEPVRMSTPEEVRAFFGAGQDTKIVVSPG